MHTPDILRCHPYTTNFFLFLSSAAQTRLPITFMGSLLPCVCACACALGHLQFRHVADALQDELRYKQHYEFKMKIYDQKHFFVPWPPQRIKKTYSVLFWLQHKISDYLYLSRLLRWLEKQKQPERHLFYHVCTAYVISVETERSWKRNKCGSRS